MGWAGSISRGIKVQQEAANMNEPGREKQIQIYKLARPVGLQSKQGHHTDNIDKRTPCDYLQSLNYIKHTDVVRAIWISLLPAETATLCPIIKPLSALACLQPSTFYPGASCPIWWAKYSTLPLPFQVQFWAWPPSSSPSHGSHISAAWSWEALSRSIGCVCGMGCGSSCRNCSQNPEFGLSVLVLSTSASLPSASTESLLSPELRFLEWGNLLLPLSGPLAPETANKV